MESSLISGQILRRDKSIGLKNRERLFFKGNGSLTCAPDPKRRAPVLRQFGHVAFSSDHRIPPKIGTYNCSSIASLIRAGTKAAPGAADLRYQRRGQSLPTLVMRAADLS